MILLLDTSTPLCRMSLIIGDGHRFDSEWQADRTLAHGLLSYLDGQLRSHEISWQEITGIGVMQGPGSFTGLRIGLTVLNTMADSLGIPIVGATGEDWAQQVVDALLRGENQVIVLPFYGVEATITQPRK